jgi:YidC/Oxa1 family membrane protein insertase
MSQKDKPTFLDRGTIIAFVVILAFWFGWTKWMEKTYPQQAASAVQTDETAPVVNNPEGKPVAKTAEVSENVAPATEVLTHYANGPWEFDISSLGMGLKNIRLKDYTSRDGKIIELAGAQNDPSFATRVAPYTEALNFAIEKTSDDTYVGTAHASGATITKTVKIDPHSYSIATSIVVSGATPALKGLATRLTDVMAEPPAKHSFFDPTPDFHSWYILHEGSNRRETIHRTEANDVEQTNAAVASLSVHYFTLAVADKSGIRPKFESKIPANAEIATGDLIYEPATMPDTLKIDYVAYAGPKSYTTLKSVDESLTGVVDYGMFAVAARPILWLLKFLHEYIANWGFAIIALTIIVRLIVLPFNVYSYKSMKMMQRIQPQMAAVRERYKDKSSEEKLQMNAEIMKLMKDNKANPLGGCLPMLLQLPVFIALYQVLGQSIELYQAPFILWIHDLSIRDPYFVTPVLMGITMFIQQKITPSTMDPSQAKIMVWMPVIFSFFMISLPAGLTLYIFVSTLFGIIQQLVFMRDRKPAGNVQAAKA